MNSLSFKFIRFFCVRSLTPGICFNHCLVDREPEVIKDDVESWGIMLPSTCRFEETVKFSAPTGPIVLGFLHSIEESVKFRVSMGDFQCISARLHTLISLHK